MDVEDDLAGQYHIVWLDKNMNSFYNRRILKKFSEIDRAVDSFTNTEEFIAYIRQVDAKQTISYIICIVSGALSEKAIPAIEECQCILGIFIFCKNIDNYEHLKYNKLRAICTDADELTNCIEMLIARSNVTTDFSMMPDQSSTNSDSIPAKDMSKDQHPIRNLKEDQASFLWFNQMHKFMVTLENDDDRKAKTEMIEHSLKLFHGQSRMLSKIEEFKSQSLIEDKEKAIFGYTDNSFIYQCTNTVFRKENVSQVYTCRYIIKLLCRQLKQQYEQFIKEYNKKPKRKSLLHLYRGQTLKSEYIHLLETNINSLISLNGFVSTTMDKDVAMSFIVHRMQKDLKPVLMKIDIDMTSEHSVAFADISSFSKFPHEQEVLLSIGSIFRVKSVKFNNEQNIYIIHLLLSQYDQLTVIKYIEQTYANNVDSDNLSVLFGKLLFDMGKCESAFKYFSDALDRLSDNNNRIRATYLNNIGICYNEMGNQHDALRYYKMAHEIYSQINNIPGVGTCQHNIASIYYGRGDYNKASVLALQALEIRHNDVERASTHDLLGCIYLASSNNVEAANDHFEQALRLRLKSLSDINPYHPDIGVSYHNLGKINEKRSEHSKAKRNYSRAAEIYNHNFPQTHSLVTQINECLRRVQKHSKR
ncbi:unnamed protein product [Rotaria sp. Silwood1]|nr:unnamed protein product [Rotaria sp. Silwood1]CAF4596813.1 unnamed protein product [Rotaria sp. Silwood1]